MNHSKKHFWGSINLINLFEVFEQTKSANQMLIYFLNSTFICKTHWQKGDLAKAFATQAMPYFRHCILK